MTTRILRYVTHELKLFTPVLIFIFGMWFGWASHEKLFGHDRSILYQGDHVPLVMLPRELQLKYNECKRCHGEEGDPSFNPDCDYPC